MPTLIKRSIPTTILFTHYGDNYIRGSERCLLDLMKHLDKNQYKAVLWCNKPLMAEAARDLGIEVHCSDFPILFGWNAPRFNFRAFLGLIREAQKLIQQYDVKLLHSNSAAPCQWLYFVAKKTNIPLVCHLHARYQFRDRLTLGLYQANITVGVSQYVIDPFIKDHKAAEQMSVIANGIDTKRLLDKKVLNLRQSLNIRLGDFVIASVGALTYRKGVDLLINALVKLNESDIPVHLLVIGSGPESENLQYQIKQLGLQQQVSFLGESDNVIGILRGTADLFVSATREEAFGLVFAEASLAGLAIVAPKIGGITDVVINNQTGLLVAHENVNALSTAIHKLYFSPTLSHVMGRAGKKHILENFTSEKNCLQFEQLYKKSLHAAAIKKPWSNRIALRWSLLTSVFSALINSSQRFIKREVIHD